MNTPITETELVIKRIEYLIEKSEKVKNKKLTPYRIAKNGQLETSTLNKVLDGTSKNVTITTVRKLCKGFNMSLREFFDDDVFN